MTGIDDIQIARVSKRKGTDGIARDLVVGHRFAHGYHSLQPGTRYENCEFYDAQLRLEGVEDVQIVNPRVVGSTFYMRDCNRIDFADGDYQGEWIHDADSLTNDRKGPTACIRTDGEISNVNVFGNRFHGVLRAWTSLASGPVSDITFGFNLFSGLVRGHADTNRGECILFHKSTGDHAVTNIASYHDTWDNWNPVDHGGDMQVGSTYHGGKKPVMDFHHVNANTIHLYRPTFGKHDTLRFTAPDGGQIRRITVEDAITDGGGISRGGDVKIITTSKLGGGELPLID